MYISLLFFLSDLEARERAASDQEFDKKKSAEDLQKEIERLRKEGSRLVEEEKERLRQEILKQRSDIREVHTERKSQEQPRLKVKWKIHKLDESHGGYNQEVLEKIFKKIWQSHMFCVNKEKGKCHCRIQHSNCSASYKIEEMICLQQSKDRKYKMADFLKF
ncbi:hypothetical protein CEXT_320462 [Caerostris extrusa]|uniref:Uncharacterized protein n=1 Tax=Caerostris extrusa TaxID=172846 RepID=A0AAV4XC26_CAEEX|nr:hypothetical protein CEXT_320462 [Caerostris extrusa]